MKLNQYLLNKIKERTFPEDVNDIFMLLESNLHRIEFVKSIIGLKNVLYLEEDSLDIEDYPYFLSLGLDFDPNDKHEAFSVLYEQAISDKEEILFQLKKFFSSGEQTLYIEIGFAETVLSNDDMFKVREHMKKDKTLEPFEVVNKLRKFPEWYEAKLAEEISVQDELFSTLYQYEHYLASDLLLSVEAQLNESLDQNDKIKFNELIHFYQDLKKHHR